MAILCVLGSGYADLETALKGKMGKSWKMVKRTLRWMVREVKRDLAITSKDFYGVKP